MERNALYVAAIQNGYEVTEEDINDWLTELRTMLEMIRQEHISQRWKDLIPRMHIGNTSMKCIV